jgi:serine/threonine protein kinase
MLNLIEHQVGPYYVIRLLGKGGHADIYLGRHKCTGKLSALKVPNVKSLASNGERFLHEAHTHVHLNHAHIIQGQEFGMDDNTPFLAMDYAADDAWHQFNRKRLPLVTIVRYIAQIADSLQYLHSLRLLHQDVKPSNILVGQSNNVFLCDFSLITTCRSHYSTSQSAIGAPAYMAPERFLGYSSEASDQYALGLIVYEWLSGVRPFHGSVSDIIFQHEYISPPSLCEMLPTLSSEVEQVVFKALTKAPCRRFASVWEFAHALHLASRSVPSSVSHYPFASSQPLVVDVADRTDAMWSTGPL